MQATLQLYGLVFLLGSLAVAALSDLKRMAAQADFAEVWGVFTIASFAVDVYTLSQSDPTTLVLKWGLIFVFFVVSLKDRGLNISLMDAAAVCAVASLLAPLEVAGFFVLVLVFKTMLSPILSKFGDAGAKPFLPVVFFSETIVLAYLLRETITQVL